MSSQPYLTAPVNTDKMPPGIPYIIGNEAAERFNFYGMRAILVVFMTQFLVNRAGAKDVMNTSGSSALATAGTTVMILNTSRLIARRKEEEDMDRSRAINVE